MTHEAHQRHGSQRDVHNRWVRRGMWVGSVVLVGLLLQSSISGCGRKGPPKPLRQQAPSERAPEGGRGAEDSGSARRTGILIRVIVTGATGRMGRRVVALVHADPVLALVGAVTHATHPALGRDAGEVAGIGPIGVMLEHDCARMLPQAEVLVDFSVAD